MKLKPIEKAYVTLDPLAFIDFTKFYTKMQTSGMNVLATEEKQFINMVLRELVSLYKKELNPQPQTISDPSVSVIHGIPIVNYVIWYDVLNTRKVECKSYLHLKSPVISLYEPHFIEITDQSLEAWLKNQLIDCDKTT